MHPLLKSTNSSTAKREFGKYFEYATQGNPVVVDNKLNNKKIVMVDYEQFIDMIELMAEINNDKLNKQIKKSYSDYKAGHYEEGLEGLIDIMNEEKKKELLRN